MWRQRTSSDELRRSASRRSGIVPGRRFALVLGLAGAVLGSSGAVALAGNSSQLLSATIFPAGGGIKNESVSLATLQAQCPTYAGPAIELYRQDGTQAPAASYNRNAAWSLGTVLGCFNPPIPVSAVRYVQVDQSGAPELSPSSQLLPPDLTSPTTDFAHASEAPLIRSDGTNIIYDRPWRGGSDANAQDEVVDTNPTSFTFQVWERTALGATVTPSQNPVAVGGTVTFTAQAAGMGPALTYTWDFGGAAPGSSAPNPTVTYTSAGTYDVTVQVADGAGNVSQSSPLPIQVGSTPPSSTSPTAPPTGPTHSSGNTLGGRPSNHRQGTSGKGGNGKSPAAGKGTHTQPAQATTVPGAAGAGQSGSGSSPAGSPRGGRGQARRPGARAVTPAKGRSPIGTGRPTVVTGRLISDVIPLSAAASPLVHGVPAPVAAAPSARRAITTSLLPALASALAVFLVFSLGAGRELRWRRPWRLLRIGG